MLDHEFNGYDFFEKGGNVDKCMQENTAYFRGFGVDSKMSTDTANPRCACDRGTDVV